MKLGVSGIIAIVIAAWFLMSCASGATEQNAITAGSYEADQLACVDKSTTRNEAEACRCIVKARYGRPCNSADAGAMLPALPIDGGK